MAFHKLTCSLFRRKPRSKCEPSRKKTCAESDAEPQPVIVVEPPTPQHETAPQDTITFVQLKEPPMAGPSVAADLDEKLLHAKDSEEERQAYFPPRDENESFVDNSSSIYSVRTSYDGNRPVTNNSSPVYDVEDSSVADNLVTRAYEVLSPYSINNSTALSSSSTSSSIKEVEVPSNTTAASSTTHESDNSSLVPRVTNTPMKTFTTNASIPDSRFEAIKAFSHSALQNGEYANTVLNLLGEYMACPQAQNPAEDCLCEPLKIGKFTLKAHELQDKEVRVLHRCSAMLDIHVKASSGDISAIDESIFIQQFYPAADTPPVLTADEFEGFVNKLHSRDAISAVQKGHLIDLDPWNDEDGVECLESRNEADARQIERITGFHFMTEEEFDELPEWAEVEDSPHYNERLRKPPSDTFVLPEYEADDGVEDIWMSLSKALDLASEASRPPNLA